MSYPAALYEHIGGIANVHLDFTQFCVLYGLCKQSSPSIYHRFYIQKKNGSQRVIEEPEEKLKQVQRALLPLLRTFPFHSCVFGLGGRERDAVNNAYTHLFAEPRVVIQMDIKDFFPATTRAAFRWAVKTYTFGYYTDLCLLAVPFMFFDNRLPQGAPTSTLASSIAFSPVDTQLAQLAEEYGLMYTRYVDDLTFSGDVYPKGFQREVNKIVQAGTTYTVYEVNHKKSQLNYRHNHRTLVTGVSMGGSLPGVGKEYKRNLRAALDQHARTGGPLTPHLEGKLEYVRRLNPPQYQSFLEYFSKRQKRWQNP